MQSVDFTEAQRFLALLGKPPGTIRLRAFYHAKNPKKAGDPGRKGGPSRSAIEQWQADGRGVYVVINDGGDTDATITACRAFFVEWDDRPREWQLTAWQELGLPEPSIQVDTGGKSIHTYWLLTDLVTPAHWSLVQSRLLDFCDADRTIKNPSRVMRLPGTYHANGAGELGALCSVVTAAGHRYSIADIEACLPDEAHYHHQQQAARHTEHTPRTSDDIRDALDAIPSAIPNQKQYPFYRNLLWSLIKVVGDTEQAVAMMQRHSPLFAEAPQVARSGGDQITAGTFWYWAKHHGWRPPQLATRPAATAVSGGAVGVEVEALNCRLVSKTDTEWLDLTLRHLFNYPADRWIEVEGILHHWCGTHYEARTDQELAPLVAAFLSQLFVEDQHGNQSHPWRRPRYVDEALSWIRRNLSPVDVNPRNAINCRNGIISWEWSGRDIHTRFEPHSPDLFFTYITEYDYDPEANQEHMWRLLEAVDHTDLDTIQRILGSGLDLAHYRATRGRPRAVLMIGEGSNGKDTIRTALRDTLGARNFTSCSLADFRQYDQGRKFPIAPLRGASVNWSSENSQFVHIDNLQSLKAAISGEELSYELKGVQESQFVPSSLFVFNLNKDPSISGEQVAIETRFHVFKFRKTFLPKPTKPNHLQADPRLKDDPDFIRRYICPAFLNWLLEGMQLAVGYGIDYSTGQDAMDAVRRSNCHLWEFCDAAELQWAGDGHSVPLKAVWERLQGWYEAEGYLVDGRWVLSPVNDPPVKAARLLVGRLQSLWPELTVQADPILRVKRLAGLSMA
jgi:phage/plasmid-associated DNA primase